MYKHLQFPAYLINIYHKHLMFIGLISPFYNTVLSGRGDDNMLF